MNIYFSGIGGVGIGPLAEIALDAGNDVQGSDLSDTPFTDALRARGVAISVIQDGEFLAACHAARPIDCFVYTAALPYDHPELLLARRLGIKTAKRDELLAQIISEKNLKLVAITGTHGKTTTTGMLIWTMQQLGIPVSYSIGTTISFGPSGLYNPSSHYFVYECDEFDRNFLHFFPKVAIITSIDHDHFDTYPTTEEYMAAFRQFTKQSDMTIMWQADADTANVALKDGWLLQPNDVLDFSLPGAHNRRNATLVSKAIEYLKLGSTQNTQKALQHFPGTDRRFERLADNLYSDYGHHPQEIAATLQLARELSDHVVLVYQPHQNVRQHDIRRLYTDCFTLAEKVYWLPTYLAREDPSLSILTAEELSKDTTNKEAIEITTLNDELWNSVQQARRAGKLVLFMGAGSIDEWLRQKLKKA